MEKIQQQAGYRFRGTVSSFPFQESLYLGRQDREGSREPEALTTCWRGIGFGLESVEEKPASTHRKALDCNKEAE